MDVDNCLDCFALDWQMDFGDGALCGFEELNSSCGMFELYVFEGLVVRFIESNVLPVHCFAYWFGLPHLTVIKLLNIKIKSDKEQSH